MVMNSIVNYNQKKKKRFKMSIKKYQDFIKEIK